MRRIKRFFASDNTLRILSFLLAIALWAFVNVVISPSTTKTIHDVAVDMSLDGTAAEALALKVIDTEEPNVDIKVEASRNIIGTVNASDFSVKPILSQVTGAGKQTLQLLVTSNVSGVTVTGYSPKSITVNFDRVSKKTLDISVDVSSVKAADGYMIAKGYASIDTITVEAPDTVVSRIDFCKVAVKSDNEVTETATYSGSPEFFDKKGAKVTSKYLTSSVYDVTVTVPVYKTANVPINIVIPELENKPISGIYKLDHDSVFIAGPPETIDTLSSIDITGIDISGKSVSELKEPIEYAIPFPEGCFSVNNIDTVTVTFNTSLLSSKRFTVTQFQTENVPDGFTATMTSKVIYNVLVIGSSSALSSMLPSDITAVVDFSSFNASRGASMWQAKITIDTQGAAWAVGDYTVPGTLGAK